MVFFGQPTEKKKVVPVVARMRFFENYFFERIDNLNCLNGRKAEQTQSQKQADSPRFFQVAHNNNFQLCEKIDFSSHGRAFLNAQKLFPKLIFTKHSNLQVLGPGGKTFQEKSFECLDRQFTGRTSDSEILIAQKSLFFKWGIDKSTTSHLSD